MIWEMNDQEFKAVSNLAGSQRYAYALKRIADWEMSGVWVRLMAGC